MGFLILSILIFGLLGLRPPRTISSGMSINDTVREAIELEITIPLRLPPSATDALYAQGVFETGNFKSKAFQATNSIWNRHKGSGRGDWTGRTYYASVNDQDLRIFESVYQCARDFKQLLTDPLYAQATLMLRSNRPDLYFVEVDKVGFSGTMKGGPYAAALNKTYKAVA